MEKSEVTKFAADAILNAVYDHCKNGADLHEEVKKLCDQCVNMEKWPKGSELKYTPQGRKRMAAETFFETCLEKLTAIAGDSGDFSEWLHFALACKIETYSEYDCREMFLFDAGNPNHAAAQFQVLIPATYLNSSRMTNEVSRMRSAALQSAGFRSHNYPDAADKMIARLPEIADKMVADVLLPVFVSAKPTSHTMSTYKTKIAHVSSKLACFFQGIPYLGDDVRQDFINESFKKLEDILGGTEPQPLKNDHSFIPLQGFLTSLKEPPKSTQRGTNATFTFGILLE